MNIPPGILRILNLFKNILSQCNALVPDAYLLLDVLMPKSWLVRSCISASPQPHRITPKGPSTFRILQHPVQRKRHKPPDHMQNGGSEFWTQHSQQQSLTQTNLNSQ